MSLQCLIEPSKWKYTADAEALHAAHTLWSFMDFKIRKNSCELSLEFPSLHSHAHKKSGMKMKFGNI